MSCADAGYSPGRRSEVFAAAGTRRSWTREEKAAIVAESYSGVENLTADARRLGLRYAPLFTWRRGIRGATEGAHAHAAGSVRAEPLFVLAVVEPSPVAVAA